MKVNLHNALAFFFDLCRPIPVPVHRHNVETSTQTHRVNAALAIQSISWRTIYLKNLRRTWHKSIWEEVVCSVFFRLYSGWFPVRHKHVAGTHLRLPLPVKVHMRLLKVSSHVTAALAFFCDLCSPVLTLSVNTIASCHRIHSLRLTQTQTLRVNTASI